MDSARPVSIYFRRTFASGQIGMDSGSIGEIYDKQGIIGINLRVLKRPCETGGGMDDAIAIAIIDGRAYYSILPNPEMI